MKISLAASALAVLALAACDSAKPATTSAASTPPAVSHVISDARATECGKFVPALLRIQDDTFSDKTVGRLAATVSARSKGWTVLLRKAGSVPASVPTGRNPARNIAVRIAQVNVNVRMLSRYATQGGGGASKIGPEWRKISRELSAISVSCRSRG